MNNSNTYPPTLTTEIVIIGATPAGVAAAVTAGRSGRKVILADRAPETGGMMASGLSRTDIRNPNTVGGLFTEFRSLVYRHYLETYGPGSEQVADCNQGLYFEPKVARRIFDQWLVDAGVQVLVNHELVSVIKTGKRISAVRLRNPAGDLVEVEGQVMIDASYEGDLAAWAGVPYRFGRESRAENNEQFAGVTYLQWDEVTLSNGAKTHLMNLLPGSSGEGDHRVQAYGYRLIMTDDPANFVPVQKPANYYREDYTSILDECQAKRICCWQDLVMALKIPNHKVDVNNRHEALISTDLPEENYAYPDGDWSTRDQIALRHKEYIQGFLWFIQNDPAMPETLRNECAQWGYARDEFQAYGNFPWQMYIREARRVVGEYTFTENDATLDKDRFRTPVHKDSIAVGDYMIDSHATRKKEPAREQALKFWLDRQPGAETLTQDRAVSYRILEGITGYPILTMPYQVPFGVIIPKGVEWLLTPGPMSATHQGYGTLRMEPVWMALGQAAATAADIALDSGIPPRSINITELQLRLLKCRQVISYFQDIQLESLESPALQFFCTRGFFDTYFALPDEPVTLIDLVRLVYLTINEHCPLTKIYHSLPSLELDPSIEGYPEFAALSTLGLELPTGQMQDSPTPQAVVHLITSAAHWLGRRTPDFSPVKEKMSRGEVCRVLMMLF